MSTNVASVDNDPPPHPHPWRVLGATSIGVIAVFISISGLTVALPTVARQLGAGVTQATWILVGYMVVATALTLVFGRLADIIGRRPVYLAGLVVYTVATGLCLLAPSANWLIAARVLQGVGAAAVITNNTALLTDAFGPAQLGRALGWNATVAAVAQVLGPLVGGAATALLGWRGLFWVCLPVGVLAIVVSLMVIPRGPRMPSWRGPFDYLGSVLSVGMLAMLVVVLTPGNRPLWVTAACTLCVVVLAAWFVAVQLRRPDPLVDLTLFRDRGMTLVFVTVLISAVATYAVALLVSLYVQAVAGSSAISAGILVVPVALGTVVAAATAGHLVARFTPRTLTATGMALNAIGLLGMAMSISAGWSVAAITPFLVVIGGGTGLFMTPSTSALMLIAPQERRGIANGLRSTLQNVGNLLSTAIALVLVTAGLADDARRAAYAGTLSGLGGRDLDVFVDNIGVTGLVLAGTAAVGVGLCLAYPRNRIGVRPDHPVPVSTVKDNA